jgi:hypothetical protein
MRTQHRLRGPLGTRREDDAGDVGRVRPVDASRLGGTQVLELTPRKSGGELTTRSAYEYHLQIGQPVGDLGQPGAVRCLDDGNLGFALVDYVPQCFAPVGRVDGHGDDRRHPSARPHRHEIGVIVEQDQHRFLTTYSGCANPRADPHRDVSKLAIGEAFAALVDKGELVGLGLCLPVENRRDGAVHDRRGCNRINQFGLDTLWRIHGVVRIAGRRVDHPPVFDLFVQRSDTAHIPSKIVMRSD